MASRRWHGLTARSSRARNIMRRGLCPHLIPRESRSCWVRTSHLPPALPRDVWQLRSSQAQGVAPATLWRRLPASCGATRSSVHRNGLSQMARLALREMWLVRASFILSKRHRRKPFTRSPFGFLAWHVFHVFKSRGKLCFIFRKRFFFTSRAFRKAV